MLYLSGCQARVVYVEQPTGYAKGDPKKKVWRLKKALYGLVEAPRLWYETLKSVLLKYGFKRITGDPCLYVLRRGWHIVILGVFVDDFLTFGTSEELVKEIKNMLGANSNTKDLGRARWVLGMRLRQLATEYILDQAQYAKDVLSRYKEYVWSTRARGRAPTTPLPANMDLRRGKETDKVTDMPFRSVLGAIGHLAIRNAHRPGVRSGIAFAIGIASHRADLERDNARPAVPGRQQEHWTGLQGREEGEQVRPGGAQQRGSK